VERVRILRTVAVVAACAVAGAALVGCTQQDRVVDGSRATVAVSGTLTSLNPNSSYGRASTLNADVAYLTGSAFAYPDAGYALVDDTSFGTAQVTSEDPFTVRYTIADDATWSDGVPVTAADLMLAWAANSGALDTPDVDLEPYVDAATGRLGELPADVVHFDGARGRGLELATQAPQPGADGRSLVLRFDEFTSGWRTALAPGLPAHVVASRALGLPLRDADADPASDADPKAARTAQDALLDAVADRDTAALSAIANVWNGGYDLTGAAPDAELLVANGPYRVTAVSDGSVTLGANPRYRGSRAPAIETIVLDTVEDPDELVRRFREGRVDVASPAPDAELASALAEVGGVTVRAGTEATFEHLDLQFADSKSGLFGDARVREAFLHVVPRQQLLDELVAPVQADAALLDSFVLRPGAEGYEETIARNGSADYQSTDVDAAVRLLEEAGVTSPEVCILYDPADARRVAAFGLIQASAARPDSGSPTARAPTGPGCSGSRAPTTRPCSRGTRRASAPRPSPPCSAATPRSPTSTTSPTRRPTSSSTASPAPTTPASRSTGCASSTRCCGRTPTVCRSSRIRPSRPSPTGSAASPARRSPAACCGMPGRGSP